MHRGYLALVYAQDGGKAGGGFAFYDVSNPHSPRMILQRDVSELREPHGFGFSRQDGELVALQSIHGLQIWDWTDVRRPELLSSLELPHVQASDYAQGAWWVFWQAPYVYVGGSSNGLFIVDASNPRAPRLKAQLPTQNTGGFRVGPVFAVGNLLFVSSMDQPGYATLDISDPVRPVLLKALTDGPEIYATLLNGWRIYGAGSDGKLYVHDIRDPSQIRLLGSSADVGGKGGYISFQDGFAFGGFSNKFAKWDVSNPERPLLVGSGSSELLFRDEDFAVVLGNLVFVGDDHGRGSALFPHQKERDTTAPEVNMISPAEGDTGVPPTSRIGLTFTDAVDFQSVTAKTVQVRPIGQPALRGFLSAQGNIINFAPEQPLELNTEYEVFLPAGGVRDYAGNPLKSSFTSRFTTGGSIAELASCELQAAPPARVGDRVEAKVQSEHGAGTKWTFDFGDKSKVEEAAEPASSHVYSEPGHYRISALGEKDGRVLRCSRVQTVYRPLAPVRPASSSPILYGATNGLVVVVNPDNDTVTAVDAVSYAKKWESPVGRNPRTLAQDRRGILWVVSQDDATLTLLHPVSGARVGSLALPYASRPFGIVFSPRGDTAYVTLESTGELARINAARRKVLGRIVVGPRPRGIAIAGDSKRLWVSRFLSPAEHGEIVTVDAKPFRVAKRIQIGPDLSPDSESSGRGVPNYLSSLVLSPDQTQLWIPSKKDNTFRGRSRDGQPLTFESTVRAMVSVVDSRTGQEKAELRRDLNDRDLPQALAFSKYGDYVFVVTTGTNTVEVLDAYTRELVSGISDVGLAPQGLVFNEDYTRLFVSNYMSRSISVYDVSGFVDGSDARAKRLASVDTVSEEKLPRSVLRGKQIFYNSSDRRMSQDGYISCASCHLEGESDERVWDFSDRGEGLRNTISLLGRRGTGMGRVHWSANFDEVQDFENDIRHAFQGLGFLTDIQFEFGTRRQPLGDGKAGLNEDLDALAAYVSSLRETRPSPERKADGSLTADARAGRALFQKLECHRCHSGPDFTDSSTGALHDVGTLTPASGQRLGQPLVGLDTPTLKGIWATAPYLHDGSASTLEDVLIRRNPEGKHGNTRALSPKQLKQLTAYLQQIDENEVPAPAPR